MGLGVYRAWIEACFVGSFVSYPPEYGLRNFFDIACVATLLACTALSRKITPLHGRRWPALTAASCMTAAGAMGFSTLCLPQFAEVFSLPASILGGVGVGVMILLWSELYGCLNPIRIALYYALSQLVGAAVIWTLKGFAEPWLALYTCALPIVSALMLRASFRTLPPERLPHPVPDRFSFPWKPVAFVSVYAFAFGLQEANTYSITGPHSGFGMIAAALVVVVGILFLSRWVDFGCIYSTWLPVLMMVALLLSLVSSLGAFATGFFISLSYGAAEIFMMTMIGSITSRYGASAVWLFGIERTVRMVAMFLGRAASPLAEGAPLMALIVGLAVIGFVLIISERNVASDWGVVLVDESDALFETAVRNALGRRCAELGRECGLTQREEEVLLLLAQRKTASDIESELCVAHGTAKAHIRHVYRKLDIHSRDELFELVGSTPTKPTELGEREAI